MFSLWQEKLHIPLTIFSLISNLFITDVYYHFYYEVVPNSYILLYISRSSGYQNLYIIWRFCLSVCLCVCVSPFSQLLGGENLILEVQNLFWQMGKLFWEVQKLFWQVGKLFWEVQKLFWQVEKLSIMEWFFSFWTKYKWSKYIDVECCCLLFCLFAFLVVCNDMLMNGQIKDKTIIILITFFKFLSLVNNLYVKIPCICAFSTPNQFHLRIVSPFKEN